MKHWFTATELTIIEGLPSTERGINKLAERESWESQKRTFGKGYEYHISNLPTDARKALEAHAVEQLLPSLATNDVPATTDTALTQRQREATDARTTIVRTIESMNKQGITKEAAMTTLLSQAAMGALEDSSPVLDKALRMAKDTRGRGDNPYPSVRTLKRWLSPTTKTLAPKGKRELVIPDWAATFMACYQRPEKPSVEHAYREFEKQWPDNTPSVHAVRRLLKKVGNVSREQGRMGAREIKNLMPFVRRTFEQLVPADIYTADGHTFDAEVSHPRHGRPFRPEITTFIDIASRKAVGYSVDLAESGIAVLDALIDSCTHAVPAMLYVDNGSGYCNALLKDEAIGVLARLGTDIRHSLPYNSQARGVIERVHQTLWIDGAKSIAGYIGKDMDREAAQLQHKLSRKAIKESGKTHLLGWENFIDFCEDRMDFYNTKPHASLPKITDTAGKRRHMSPNENWAMHQSKGWEAHLLTQDQAADVFRPRVTRKVLRGEIRLLNNRYFSRELEEFHGDSVQVAFDFRDAQYIWVYDQEQGRLICKAEWNANTAHYMPMSYIMQAREKRADARLKRVEVKIDEIEAERRGSYALDQNTPTFIPGIGNVHDIQTRIKAKQQPEVIEIGVNGLRMPEQMTPDERLQTYQAYESGTTVPEEHRRWVTTYPRSKEYKSLTQRFAEF
ncbi:Mu transposase C-terminal domain-containing protein [Neptunomonas japonica]|uniref:Mu transposase C-terminal domain-containing protein n=1 Tax=Neptunomonas japonica TaxID=417574 RepID=UPI000411FDE5|nr:Mu transposase C-terminal domain-containing protein [Neptunomonas japonica]